MTNIDDLLEKIKGDRLNSDEFVRLVTAVKENQLLGKKLDDNKVGYVIRTTDEGIYARFFVDEDTANNYILNPEDPDFQPIVSIPLPSGGGGETVYEVNLFSNTPLAIASPNRNINISLAFTTQSYVASTDTWRDNAEDGIIAISRKIGDGAWEVVKTLPNFTRTIYSERNTNQKLVDLSDCLINGEQQIMIGATGSRTLATAVELIFDITVAEMSIQNTTNWQEPKIYNPIVAASANINLNYKIVGTTNKSLYYKIYGPSGDVLIQNAANVGTWSDSESSYLLSVPNPLAIGDMAAPGIIKVEAWLRSNGTLAVETESVFINLMVTTIEDNDILLVINNLDVPLINWTSKSILDWAVYNKQSLVGTNVRFVIQNSDGSSIWVDTTTSGATNETVYTFAPYLNAELEDPTFDAVIKAYIDNVEVYSKAVSVDNSNSFAPTSNANFILLPSMRSNADANKRVIINETQLDYEPKQINAIWDNVVFEKDGWTTDGDNVKILKLFAGSSVQIDYSPYTTLTSGSGLTMEFDIKTSNISDENEPILKIGHYNEQEKFIGLIVYPKSAYMYSNLNQAEYFQDIEWGEDERIHITVNIMPGLEVYRGRLNLCRLYINGGIENEFDYDPNTDSFGLNTDKIIIGGAGADISVYGIRFYKDRQLSSDQILNDYISSLSDVQEKLRLISANNIKDGGVISYELASIKYNTLLWRGEYASFENQGKFRGDLDINIIDDPAHSGTITNMEESGQGTSAKTYYKWNGSFKHTDTSVWTDGNGVVKGNYYQLTNGSPKMKKEVGKINYASSPQAHKAGACEMFNVLHTAVCGLTGVQRTVQARNIADGKSSTAELPRVAIEEKPFLFFVQSPNDSTPKFYGLITWGSPKGDAATFGYDKNTESVLNDYLMIEGSDHSPKLTLNQVPWFEDEVPYNEEEEYYMYNGEGSWDYDLGNQNSLHKIYDAFNFAYKYGTRIRMWNGSVINLKNSQDINPDGSNYADRTYQYIIINSSIASENYTVHRFNFPTSEWVNAGITKTNGQYDEYNVDIDLNLGLSGQTVAPGEALTTIKNARIAMFREHASDYFDVDDMLFLMQFLKLIGASDNRAKNTYLYYDPVDDCVRNAQDDLDTILPFNNQGQKQKFYWAEEHDVETRSDFGTLWAGGENNMYNTFEDAFREELELMMRNIFTAMINDAGSPLAFFNKYFFYIQNYIPTVAYNETARLFYEEAIFATQKGTDTDPLTQSRGKQLSAELEWVKNRIVYIASYCSYYQATGSSIVFRQETSSQYNEIPAMKLYLFRRNGTTITGPDGYDRRSNSSIYSQRTDKNVSRQFTVTSTDTVQTTTELAEYLLDIGDLSGASVSGSVDFSAGKRLVKIKAGAATTPNFHPSVISGLPVNIQELDIRNITSLTSIPSLENMSKLRKLLAEGTNLTGVILPQTNNLRELTLPSTLTSLTLRNQANLFDANFSYTPTYLKSLTIGNVGISVQTFIFSWLEILKTKTLDNTYTLIADGIRWLNVDASDFVDLMAIPNIILKGSVTFDANSISVEQLAIVNTKLGTLIATGDLVLNYTNIVSLNLSKSTIVGDDESSYATFEMSSLDYTKQLTLQISTDGETWTTIDEEHPATYLTASNIHDESGSVGKTIIGTLIAPTEVDTNIQYRLRAFDTAKYSVVQYLNVSIKNRFTSVSINGTKYLTETQHQYGFNAAISPNNASEVPAYTWSIRSVGDTSRYDVVNTSAYSRIVRKADSAIMVELIKANSSSVNVTTGTELMTAKNNNTSFVIACNVLGSYGSEVEATYEVIGHAIFTPKAVQSYDPEEDNYNPALVIYLKNNEATTGVTLHEQTFDNGSRGFYMTQEEAASVTNLGTINGLTRLQDVNGYVVESYESGILNPKYYTFDNFDNYKYFTRFTSFVDISNCTNLESISLSASVTTVGFFVLPASLRRVKFEEGCIGLSGTWNYVWNNIPNNQLTLYIPSTWNPNNQNIQQDPFTSRVATVYYNGTIEQWLNTRIYNDYNGTITQNNNVYAGGFDLYCKNVLVTEIDANVYNAASHKENIGRCKSLVRIIGEINNLGDYRFINCQNLQSVTLNSSITTIPQYCFYGCSALQLSTIPSHITTIAANAFSGSGASFNEIPDTVTSFGTQSNMPNITSISYPNTMTTPGGFSNCANLRSIFFRKADGEDFVITSYPKINGVLAYGNLSKVGYEDNFFNNTLITPNTIIDNLGKANILGDSGLIKNAVIYCNSVYPENIISIDLLKFPNVIEFCNLAGGFVFVKSGNVVKIVYIGPNTQVAKFHTSPEQMLNCFIHTSIPPTVPQSGTNNASKLIVPAASKSNYANSTHWNYRIGLIIEYDYVNDPANIVSALKYQDVILGGIPLANCTISINGTTATISCNDTTISGSIINIHYRIKHDNVWSNWNIGNNFTLASGDSIEAYGYATNNQRGPSNMLKAAWNGSTITYDYTDIYIAPNDVDSNGNLI